jgi:hypothetical protein
MDSIARPAHAKLSIFHRISDASLQIGAVIDVGPGDYAVVTSNRAVLGVVPPGTHSLHPQALPGLAQAAGANSQLNLWFVRTTPIRGVRLGGSLGPIVDPATGTSCAVRCSGECSLGVSDPARFIAACESAEFISPDPVFAWASSQLLRKVTELLARPAVAPRSLLDPELTENLVRDLPGAMGEFAATGLRLLALDNLSISIDEGDAKKLQSKMAELARAKQAAGHAPAPRCGHCGTAATGGRFCVECGAPFAAP